MKELSIEGKATRYDEALKEAVIAHKDEDRHLKATLERIFLELKESEDEKIRKWIIDYFKENNAALAFRGISNESVLAWLEKQGEQKPAEHFELKAGHWYICHRAYCCRADHLTVKEGERFMCEKDGIVKGFVIKEPEKYFKEVCPPASIEDVQKSAWSEEDVAMLDSAISFVEHSAFTTIGKGKNNVIAWLKSLRPQSQWKPSEGQLECLGYAIDKAEKDWSPLTNNRIYLTLKALKEQLEKL